MLTSQYKVRSKMLKLLGFANYKSYLQSEHWAKRRSEYEAGHPKTCTYCDHPATDLHHLNYEALGAERDADLQWVCVDHHGEIQRYGQVKPASGPQKGILRQHGYPEPFIGKVTMGVAFKLIGRLGRRTGTWEV